MRELNNDFGQFTGTENYYKHWAGFGCFTDGVKAVADTYNAYWLIDAVLSYRRKEEFQLWTLSVKDSKAVLIMQEDDGKRELVRQEIEYTTFPEGVMKLYFQNNILFLPSEY